jgi:hypothetical protein
LYSSNVVTLNSVLTCLGRASSQFDCEAYPNGGHRFVTKELANAGARNP